MILNYINSLQKPWDIVTWIAIAIGILAVCFLLIRLNKLVFKRISKRSKGLHWLFFQHLISILIVLAFVVLVISSFAGVKTVWTTVFGGTAIVSAVAAFAAQDVIKDILAGIMMSANRPFEVGDRIILEDGTAGIVENITLRHIVLKGPESLRFVIPNHVINAMRLSNFSFKSKNRSVLLKFSVGYDSDPELVKKVIAKAVEKSEYSIEGYYDGEGNPCYGGVYFVEFADSALIMQVSVYYLPTTATEKVIDDINVRVKNALNDNGIEIPYNYLNVVERPSGKGQKKTVRKPVTKALAKPAEKTSGKKVIKSAKKTDKKAVKSVKKTVKK